MRFCDKVAIVTGAAGGIGLATAKRLGSEGARVIIADLKGDAAEKALPACVKPARRMHSGWHAMCPRRRRLQPP